MVWRETNNINSLNKRSETNLKGTAFLQTNQKVKEKRGLETLFALVDGFLKNLFTNGTLEAVG